MSKNFIVKPGEVLKGASLLKKDKNSIDRVEFIRKYKHYNYCCLTFEKTT